MIAAPGSSILPSLFPSSRGASRLLHACISCSSRASPRRSAAACPASSAVRSGTILQAAEVGRRGRVHRGDHGRGRVLLPRRELARQQLHPLQRAVRPVVVRRREAAGGLVVPVEDHAAARVDRLRVRLPRLEAAPLEVAVPVCRQPEVDARGPDRQPPGGEVRDVAVVRVRPVEAELDLVHRARRSPCAEWTRALSRSSKASALRISRPRVERFVEIATFWPPTVA